MKRNVLLITIDAFGAVKCWQKCKHLAPFINNIGEKGTVFRQAIGATSSTTSSIASIHTGLYPKEHGIESTYGYHLKDSVKTLAEILRENGYQTFATVGGPLFPETQLNRGFERYVYRSSEYIPRFLKWGIVINRMKLNSLLLDQEAKKIFTGNEPWFYWIHLLDLHNRWRGGRWFKDRNLSPYENALLPLDRKIKRIINSVDLKNTLLIVCADHGHHVKSLDPARPGIDWPEGHGFHLYDTLVRIPLIFIGDGLIPQGKSVEEQVASIDIMPTILELLHLNKDIEISGKSLTDYLLLHKKDDNEKQPQERPAYMEACGGFFKHTGEPFLMGLRTPRWKYVVSQDKKSGRVPELYDLVNDPQEMHNVCHAYPKVESELRKTLLEIADCQSRK